MQHLKMKVEHDNTTDNVYKSMFFTGKRLGSDIYLKTRLVYEIRKVMNELLDSSARKD